MGNTDADRPRTFIPRPHRRRILVLSLSAVDILMVIAAGRIATIIRFGSDHQRVVLEGLGVVTDYAVIAAVFAVALPVFIAFERLYDLDSLFWGSGEFTRVFHSTSFGIAALVIGSYLLEVDNLSRAWLVLLWCLSSMCLAAGRWVFRIALRSIRLRGHLLRPAIMIGDNGDAAHLCRSIAYDYASGLSILGCLVSPGSAQAVGTQVYPGIPIVGDTSQLVQKISALRCDAVVIAASAFEHAELTMIISELRRLPIDLHVSAGLYDVLTSRVVVREMGGAPMMKVRGMRLSTRDLLIKRGFDIAFSSLVITLGLPLWLMVAAAIKLDSRGPVFYRQQRAGCNGTPFSMYKFRSMHAGADTRLTELRASNEADGLLFKIRRDPRVTRVGRVIRKYSIDEIPQFLNVLLGHMSVVGPRPPLPVEAACYTSHHMRRLTVPPGVTGLWQVSGRSDLSFDEMVRLDLFYIENWSLRYDLTLVARTLPTVLLAEGAY